MMTIKAYERFDRIYGLRFPDQTFEAIGFDSKGRLCHLTQEGYRAITLAESVSLAQWMEQRFVQENGHDCELDEEREPRDRWYALLKAVTAPVNAASVLTPFDIQAMNLIAPEDRLKHVARLRAQAEYILASFCAAPKPVIIKIKVPRLTLKSRVKLN